ncbi:hypothetical protein [Pseudooceanicola atlanticus]|uniref:hypothetical protein n=1 Tax=Pseudooceanicola atlanticus TaxID=1461694 RepID=UPI00235475D3|nr:hypothetical protein [Pseudooceanicola atlanticus]
MAFSRADRQRIIDGYLAATRRNHFVPQEFVDWLGGNPEHEAYDWFFGSGDEEAARQHRISLARNLANGLRITAPVSSAPLTSAPAKVAVREYPALVSPVAGRRDGGGYQPFHPDDPAMVAELRRQGAQALKAWLSRYRGVAEQSVVDVAPIEEIVARMSDDVAGAA